MAEGPGYKVKSVEPVAIGSDVQARLFTLAPGETIPWHFHSAITDWYFVLAGALCPSRPGHPPTGSCSRSAAAIIFPRRRRI